jgi:carbon starvation protein CstA
LIIAIPLFVVGFILLQVNFDVIWRYFAWSNQTLAAATLWMVTVYLALAKKLYWISLIPAIFMTMVVTVYIMVAPEGLQLPIEVSYIIGGIFTVIVTTLFFVWKRKRGIEDM